MISGRPILVTGSPRSGSTWVGRVLSITPGVRYIHEPFNISGLRCPCGFKIPYWFYYVTADNEKQIKSHLDHLLDSQFNQQNINFILHKFWATKRLRVFSEAISGSFATRSTIKDPLAVLSAEWLANTYNMEVVLLIRHPAAIIYSFERLEWPISFSHFINQPKLMEDHLHEFENQIMDQVNNETDLIDQAALLWRILHYMILKYQKTHRDWIYKRYEDIAAQPEYQFTNLFECLELPTSDRVLKRIRDYSANTNPTYSDNPYSIYRSSKNLIRSWRAKFTISEITRIRNLVEDISHKFYDDDDWQ